MFLFLGILNPKSFSWRVNCPQKSWPQARSALNPKRGFKRGNRGCINLIGMIKTTVYVPQKCRALELRTNNLLACNKSCNDSYWSSEVTRLTAIIGTTRRGELGHLAYVSMRA